MSKTPGSVSAVIKRSPLVPRIKREEAAFVPYRALFLGICNVVEVPQSCHGAQRVQVGLPLTQPSCKQRQGHPMLNTALPEGAERAPCFQPPRQAAQKPALKNRKRNQETKAPRAVFRGMQRQTSQLSSCFVVSHRTEGHPCLLHCPRGEVCMEGQQSVNQSVNQSIHHKHP